MPALKVSFYGPEKGHKYPTAHTAYCLQQPPEIPVFYEHRTKSEELGSLVAAKGAVSISPVPSLLSSGTGCDLTDPLGQVVAVRVQQSAVPQRRTTTPG